MAEDIVVVATGADRSGVMDELSQFLSECGGNIIQSRSINLAGTFSLLMLVRGEAGAIESIRSSAQRMNQSGIQIELRPASGLESTESTTFPFIFVATGKDRIGVLHRISHLMRVLKINIEDVQTKVARDASFEVRLALAVPRETPISMVREYLEFLCKELGINGELTEA